MFTCLHAAEGLEVHNYKLVEPFLSEHCVRCHGPEEQRGKFRVDTLGQFINSQSEAEDWQEMLDLINAGEMPPPDEDQPSSEELVEILNALYKTTSDTRDVISKNDSGVMRRMNRREYANTIEDRLGIRITEDLLPVDPGDFGFDTFRNELVVTPTQLEGYLATGQELIGRLIRSRLSPQTMSDSAKYIFKESKAESPAEGNAEGGKPKPKGGKKKKKKKKAATKSTPSRDSDEDARPLFERYIELLYSGRKPSGSLISDMESLFREGRDRDLDFWQAIVDPMVVALASPNFIYVVEEKQSLTQTEIANRMALLLWGAASPDQELVDLAAAKKLLNRDVFVQQVTRMLKNKKAERFYNSFGDQWLELDRLDLVVVNDDLFPEIAENEKEIKDSMREQVREYLRELISNNVPASQLGSSDFAMIDPVLADYYGIKYPGKGKGFKRVTLEGENLARGGILGQGAIQMLTSTGSRTSPVERGVYVLRKLLNSSPPPPPADVPEIEDDPKVEKSTRELLAHHSTTPQCATCHNRIDNIGFGMESFGPMGRLQKYENEHAKGRSKKIEINAKGRMPDGASFESFNQLKELVAKSDEAIARSYVSALMSYAIGRPVGFGDRSQIDLIIENSRSRDFSLAELTFRVCASNHFKTKN